MREIARLCAPFVEGFGGQMEEEMKAVYNDILSVSYVLNSLQPLKRLLATQVIEEADSADLNEYLDKVSKIFVERTELYHQMPGTGVDLRIPSGFVGLTFEMQGFCMLYEDLLEAAREKQCSGALIKRLASAYKAYQNASEGLLDRYETAKTSNTKHTCEFN